MLLENSNIYKLPSYSRLYIEDYYGENKDTANKENFF